MKKLNYLFLSALMALCLVSFAACSDDDDDDDNSTVVGSWKLSTEVVDAQVTPATLKVEVDAYLKSELSEAEGSVILDLNKDNTCKITKGEESVLGTYNLSGSKLTITPNVTPAASAEGSNKKVFTVVRTGNALVLSGDVTVEAKELLDEDNAWEEMETEKPEGFVLTKATLSSTFRLAPEPR